MDEALQDRKHTWQATEQFVRREPKTVRAGNLCPSILGLWVPFCKIRNGQWASRMQREARQRENMRQSKNVGGSIRRLSSQSRSAVVRRMSAREEYWSLRASSDLRTEFDCLDIGTSWVAHPQLTFDEKKGKESIFELTPEKMKKAPGVHSASPQSGPASESHLQLSDGLRNAISCSRLAGALFGQATSRRVQDEQRTLRAWQFQPTQGGWVHGIPGSGIGGPGTTTKCQETRSEYPNRVPEQFRSICQRSCAVYSADPCGTGGERAWKDSRHVCILAHYSWRWAPVWCKGFANGNGGYYMDL